MGMQVTIRHRMWVELCPRTESNLELLGKLGFSDLEIFQNRVGINYRNSYGYRKYHIYETVKLD